MKIKKIFLIIFFSLIFLSISSCKKNEEKKQLIVSTNAEFKPFEYVENGKVIGFDIDFIKAYADKNNLELVINDVDFDGALLSVSSKKADLAIAGITVNEKRKETLSFSESYFVADQVIIVKNDSKYLGLNQIDLLLNLTKDNAKIGCQRGTTGEYYIEEIENAEAKLYDNGALAVADLNLGRIDAVIIDSEPAKVYTKAITGVTIIPDIILTKEEYAIAVSKDNNALLDSLNEFIRESKNNGTLDNILSSYFGENNAKKEDDFLVKNNIKQVLIGLRNTLFITFGAFIIGLFIGVLVSIVNNINSHKFIIKVLKFISKAYVMIFRGTPVMVQLLIIYYVIFKSYNGNALFIGLIAFGLNSGAYVSEIIRGGIASISIGQMEAGRSLGLNYRTVMRKIILPQAVKNTLPSLSNEVISLIKETSVVGFIGAFDLTLAFRKIANATYDYTSAYLLMGLIYFILVLLLSYLLKLAERRFAHDRT